MNTPLKILVIAGEMWLLIFAIGQALRAEYVSNADLFWSGLSGALVVGMIGTIVYFCES